MAMAKSLSLAQWFTASSPIMATQVRFSGLANNESFCVPKHAVSSYTSQRSKIFLGGERELHLFTDRFIKLPHKHKGLA